MFIFHKLEWERIETKLKQGRLIGMKNKNQIKLFIWVVGIRISIGGDPINMFTLFYNQIGLLKFYISH